MRGLNERNVHIQRVAPGTPHDAAAIKWMIGSASDRPTN
jgi:hypothetical protein